jgi:hypothetical protein
MDRIPEIGLTTPTRPHNLSRGVLHFHSGGARGTASYHHSIDLDDLFKERNAMSLHKRDLIFSAYIISAIDIHTAFAQISVI